MTADIQDLYQRVIVDHSRQPHNCRVIDGGPSAERYNPLCGDRVTVYVCMEGNVIRDASFQGAACAIVIASASLMTGSVTGRTRADATVLGRRFQRMITTPFGAPIDDLGVLTALAGVRMFPTRMKCATLPWDALRAALAGQEE